ncbi:hypothetical protein I308_105319 [Cryptococcus tetragattii IND107]|uniref:Uncharacterized protein n=1 Tax=Cryptococcus tetragattii IND107 TaxID=1296105 RepID=A0ABR3BR26_9TREE
MSCHVSVIINYSTYLLSQLFYIPRKQHCLHRICDLRRLKQRTTRFVLDPTTKSEQLLQRSTGSFIAKQLRIVIDGVFANNRVVSHPPVLLKDHPASVF